MEKLQRDFFAQDTLVVAKELLGKVLCRKYNDRTYKGIIVETEAYKQEEPACHAHCGVTKRSKTLFEKPGTFYVYFIYGMYHCANVVTEKEGYGSAVLIRALEPVENIERANGPSILCKEMSIDCTLNEIDITAKNSVVWIEDGEKINAKDIVTTTRIGIKKAADLPWRFYVKDNKWISKK